jgi:C-terminal processing protease CtpA/Prc
MGEHSNGSTGQPYMFNLPAGASGQICTRHETYPDGRRFVGNGIIPDIEVKRTISDVINNCDGVLDEAVKYLLSHK